MGKRGQGGKKGGKFEREMCVKLSEWWSKGKEDDLFWRTHGSGARATTRHKKGKITKGQYGDICATDGRGKTLTKTITISLKRGYSKHTFQDLIDCLETNKEPEYARWIREAKIDHESSGALEWMIIVQRDRRKPIALLPFSFWMRFPFNIRRDLDMSTPSFIIRTKIKNKEQKRIKTKTSDTIMKRYLDDNQVVFALLLDNFLRIVDKSIIKGMYNQALLAGSK